MKTHSSLSVISGGWIRFALVAVVLSLFGRAQGGEVWWVDCHSAVSPQTGSEFAPFLTIQAAVNRAVAGDTIKVKPGVYDAGDTEVDTLTGGGNRARVLVDKKLRIESTDGASVTHIVGASASEEEIDGMGDDAIRCVTILNAAAGSVLKGFTIRDGRSRYDDNANQVSTHAGGVLAQDDATYIVDCVVSNCVATRAGAVHTVTAIRTLFVHNRATNNGGSATRNSRHYACIFAHNGDESDLASKAAVADAKSVVNCTFVGNGNGAIHFGTAIPTLLYNSVAILEGPKGASVIIDKNSVSGGEIRNFAYCKVKDYSTAKPVLLDLTDVSDDCSRTLISPFTGDFRPLAGGACDGTGDPALTVQTWVPEEFRGVDFNGNPLVVDGKTDLGAVCGAAIPESGTLWFNRDVDYYSIDGLDCNALFNGTVYVRGNEVLRQICIHAKETVFGFKQTGSWAWYRYPNIDGVLWMTLPPVGSVVSNGLQKAASICYVNEKIGSNDYDGKSPTVDGDGVGPMKTLQAAVDAAPDWSVVKVAPGTYAEGSSEGMSWTNRVYISENIVLRGSGADVTFIKGCRDTTTAETDYGCGPAAVRCVAAAKNRRICVCGFTLTDGCVSGGSYALAQKFYGGGFCADTYGCNAQLMDCVITNCAGSRGGVVYGGWMQRCLVTDCHVVGTSTGTEGSESFRDLCMSSCVIRDTNPNQGGYATVANGTTLLANNTFIGNGNRSTRGDLDAGVNLAMNCVIVDKTKVVALTKYGRGNYQNGVNGTYNGFNYVANLNLVDKANRDLRPRVDSVLIGGGSTGDATVIADQLTAAQWFAMLVSSDIDGQPVLFRRGIPVAGAYQRPVPVVQVEARVTGEIAPVGNHVVNEGGALTITAEGDVARKFLGFEIGGEFIALESKSYDYVQPTGVCVAPVIIKAIYNSDWYVDATNGNDSADGWTPQTAKKTLVEAMKGPVPGDVVHAAIGVYDSKEVEDSAGSVTKCRVAIPAGVTLMGDDRDRTIIEGAAPPDPDQYGLGDGAVRCVFLYNGSKVCNMTLRHGYTKHGALAMESFGAGVVGESRTQCLVEDCNVCECHGSRSGAGEAVTFNRCRLMDNQGVSLGAAGRNCSYWNTSISGSYGGGRILFGGYDFINCTYVSDGIEDASARNLFASGHARIVNSVFLAPYCALSEGVTAMTNVVFVTGSGISQAIAGVNVTTNSADEIKVDANGLPQSGSCLINAGERELVAEIGARDCAGGQRVYDGEIDIGAFEYDWRGDYAKVLGNGFSVETADPDVVEDEGALFIREGSVGLRRTVASLGRMRGKITVSGTGVLALSVDGTPFGSYTAGEHELVVPGNRDANTELLFSYVPGLDDAGGASLHDFIGLPTGTILVVH